jgi:hypothetical protein
MKLINSVYGQVHGMEIRWYGNRHWERRVRGGETLLFANNALVETVVFASRHLIYIHEKI